MIITLKNSFHCCCEKVIEKKPLYLKLVGMHFDEWQLYKLKSSYDPSYLNYLSSSLCLMTHKLDNNFHVAACFLRWLNLSAKWPQGQQLRLISFNISESCTSYFLWSLTWCGSRELNLGCQWVRRAFYHLVAGTYLVMVWRQYHTESTSRSGVTW